MWQIEFSRLLRADFAARKQQNPRYSIRAYAKKLGLSHSSLVNILNESPRWRPSPKTVKSIAVTIGLSPTTIARLDALMGLTVMREPQPIPEGSPFLTDSNYILILAAFGLPRAERNSASISKRLGISTEEVEKIIGDLLQWNLIETGPDGLQRTSLNWTTTADISNAANRIFHRDSLHGALHALENIPHEDRDFTSITVTGRRDKMGEIKKEIRTFLAKMNALMEGCEDPDEIFRLNVCLYPLKTASAPKKEMKNS